MTSEPLQIDYRELARELAQHLKDYECVQWGELTQGTWEKNRGKLLAKAEAVFELIPF